MWTGNSGRKARVAYLVGECWASRSRDANLGVCG